MTVQELISAIKNKSVEMFHKFMGITKSAWNSDAVGRFKSLCRWENVKPKLEKAATLIVHFTKEQPRTAGFIYACLFCSFSIKFLDLPFALDRLRVEPNELWTFLATINPSGWWFLVLIVLWLIYMAVAGLSLTTEAFERNLAKARMVAFVLLSLSISSLFTILFNILVGRYTPEFLETMNLYGFSAFRFRLTETSFPSFGVQSIWAVMMAVSFYFPRFKKFFIGVAILETIALPMVADCFLSDAVMGTYVGIIMYYAARWIVSENRENTPIFTR